MSSDGRLARIDMSAEEEIHGFFLSDEITFDDDDDEAEGTEAEPPVDRRGGRRKTLERIPSHRRSAR